MAFDSKDLVASITMQKIYFGVLGEFIHVYGSEQEQSFRYLRFDAPEQVVSPVFAQKKDIVLLGCLLSGELGAESDEAQTFAIEFELTKGASEERCEKRMNSVVAYALGVSEEWLNGISRRAVVQKKGMCKLFSDSAEPYFCAQLNMFSSHAPKLSGYELNGVLYGLSEIVENLLSASILAMPVDEKEMSVISAVRRYMEKHCQRSTLTMADVAREVGFSRAQLHRLFARHHLSLSELLKQIRMKRATKLLYADSGCRIDIEMIAQLCGYGDLSAFSKAFKKVYGVPPSVWREQKNHQMKEESIVEQQAYGEELVNYG